MSEGSSGEHPHAVQLELGRFVHPIYREQLHAVPAGFRYVSGHSALRDETLPTKRVIESSSRVLAARRRAERLALRGLSRAGHVHRVRTRALPGAKLIHSAERLIVDSPLPYVLDFEHAELFVLYQRRALTRPWARRLLRASLLDPQVRRLLPWSEAARRSLVWALRVGADDALVSRMEVVYPSIRAAVDTPQTSNGKALRLLFVGTAFYEKGAVDALRAVERVAATHDVHLDLVSYVPDDRRRALAGRPWLTVHQPGSAAMVRSLYEGSDALLFPSHMDTFGFVVLEAMAHGLPVLAPDHLALSELVEHDGSGLLFAPENMLYRADTSCAFPDTLPPPRSYIHALRNPSDAYVDGIAKAIARLAEDRSAVTRLGHGALESVKTGRFSVARRREALAKIYAAAMD